MVSGARRRLADNLAAQSIPEDPEYISDPFSRGIAAALQRRGITSVPGMKTAAEEAHERHRQHVRNVVDALTVRPKPAPPEPEPEQQSLPDQLRSMIGQQYGTELPLNGKRLTDHLVRQLQNPGGGGAQAGQSASGSDAT